MTAKERLAAAAKGGTPDQKPLIVWPKLLPQTPSSEADAWVVDAPHELSEAKSLCGDSAVLSSVLSPFGWAHQKGIPLMKLLESDPKEGDIELQKLQQMTLDEARARMDEGADGLCYVLAGAGPDHTTPMQYGGFLLDLDREILEEFTEADFNLVWVRGHKDPYLEFVADLPCHALSWDMAATGIQPASIRPYRTGAIAGDRPDCDLFLLDRVLEPDHLAAALEATRS